MDERHALRSGEVNLMDAQWTSPEAPAHEFARQDARQLELTPVNLVLANTRWFARIVVHSSYAARARLSADARRPAAVVAEDNRSRRTRAQDA